MILPSDFIEFLAEHVHEDYDLIKTLSRRVAFHYGVMPPIVRSRVEDLFESGKLKYICCTSTLLHGVNLPARHVVIERPNKGNGQPMPRADFLNLAGRAGRLLKEFQGNVWCLQPEQWKVRSFEGDPLQDISSAFERALADGGTLIRQFLQKRRPLKGGSWVRLRLGRSFPSTLSQESRLRSRSTEQSRTMHHSRRQLGFALRCLSRFLMTL